MWLVGFLEGILAQGSATWAGEVKKGEMDSDRQVRLQRNDIPARGLLATIRNQVVTTKF